MRTTHPKASNLYVKNLDASIDDRTLEEHFSAFGKVISAKVMRLDNGFVSFSDTKEAKRALDALRGTVFQGWSLYVAIAQIKEERRKEMQSYSAQYPLQSLQYSSNSDILTLQFHPTYYNFPPIPASNPASLTNSCQPMMYKPFGIILGAAYPFTEQSYQIPT